jgi:hypothetical protein
MYERKKDGGDDNNADDENEPGEIRGKKKKANRGALVRVAWYFCIIPRRRRWFATRKEAQLLHWHDEGRKELNYKKDGKFRHRADQRNGVTLIPTSHGLMTQGAYGLL